VEAETVEAGIGSWLCLTATLVTNRTVLLSVQNPATHKSLLTSCADVQAH